MTPLSPHCPKASISSALESLICPVTLEPLETAVTLIPCMHKVNESVARHLYPGTVIDDGEIAPFRSYYKCTVCREHVRAWKVDHQVREVVRALLGHPKSTHLVTMIRLRAKNLFEEEESTARISLKFLRSSIHSLSRTTNQMTARVLSLRAEIIQIEGAVESGKKIGALQKPPKRPRWKNTWR
jgi:hypothetical protein